MSETLTLPTTDEQTLNGIHQTRKNIHEIRRSLYGLFTPFKRDEKARAWLCRFIRRINRPELKETDTGDVRAIFDAKPEIWLDQELHDVIYGKNIPTVVYLIRLYRKFIQDSNMTLSVNSEVKPYSGGAFYIGVRITLAKILSCKQDYVALENAICTLVDLYHGRGASKDILLTLLDRLETFVLEGKVFTLPLIKGGVGEHPIREGDQEAYNEVLSEMRITSLDYPYYSLVSSMYGLSLRGLKKGKEEQLMELNIRYYDYLCKVAKSIDIVNRELSIAALHYIGGDIESLINLVEESEHVEMAEMVEVEIDEV